MALICCGVLLWCPLQTEAAFLPSSGANTPPSESRENENTLEAKKYLAAIEEKNSLLALELAKLPELKKTITIKEVASLKNIIKLYEIDPLVFNSAFDKMYAEGIPEIRKFCTPLQALFWLAGKEGFSKQNNPLLDYDLESFLNKAWGVQGVVLLEEDVQKILTEPVYVEDRREIKSVLSRLSTDSSIFSDPAFQDEVRERWSNFEEVTDRLNSPRLVFKYIRPNLYYPQTLRKSTVSPFNFSPEQIFKLKIGNCGRQALFVDYCLKKAGYEAVIIRYVCKGDGFCGPNREQMSYTNPTPYHWTVAFKEGGLIYELDAGRHYLGGPYKDYAKIAGGNPFVIYKSWQDNK